MEEFVRTLTSEMLKSNIVDVVVAFVEGVTQRDLVPAFLSNPEDCKNIKVQPFNPTSLARIYKDYGEKDKKAALVLKSCDVRAVIELVKRNQLSIDNLYLIGIVCYGSYPIRTQKESLSFPSVKEETLRSNCRRCEYPIPTLADICCKYENNELIVEAFTEKGRDVLKRLNIESKGKIISQDLSSVREGARKWQEEDFSEIQTKDTRERLSFWLSHFQRCIKCYGCRNVCPVCYCKDCYLDAGNILIKGGEIPPDLLFHLTRLAHIADSCVNCGQCEDVCPAEIPLSRLFHMVNCELKETFHYEPGMSFEPPPLGTFTEEELSMGGVEIG